ncbi:MAG: translation initiation factor IF-3 [Flavobacteriales bacterium]|nr:MAG: translation initiation factor IF-3 [Flavobacteriales bacterium]
MAKRFSHRGRRRFVKKEDPHKINEKILAKEVRVIADGVEPDVYSIEQALKFADEQELDLVEISPNAKPPVCKIIDYKKFLYDQKKKQKEIKAKAQKMVLKEIRFGPNTDDHDFEFKTKHARKFIEEGAKVKAFVFFKGRTIIFKDRGQILLLKLAQELEDIATVEALPKMDGKRMFMYLSPKKKNK